MYAFSYDRRAVGQGYSMYVTVPIPSSRDPPLMVWTGFRRFSPNQLQAMLGVFLGTHAEIIYASIPLVKRVIQKHLELLAEVPSGKQT